MQLSIIIPTLNEAVNIGRLVRYLYQFSDDRLSEIIVANATKTNDNTAEVAIKEGALVVNCECTGRANQMNYASLIAKGDVFYFVHADAIPPKTYLDDIENALNKGYQLGYFSYQHDSKCWLLRINGYYTRFDGIFTGGGDQTLFIKKKTFNRMNGFNNECLIMEDFELMSRIRHRRVPFTIIQNDVIVSARKYANHGYWRVNLSNLLVFIMFKLNFPQKRIVDLYKRLLN